MIRSGIAADHGGFELKVQLTAALKAAGYEVADFGGRPCGRIRDCLPVGGATL
jgi:ribose 5-phosphate isomerase RpiB